MYPLRASTYQFSLFSLRRKKKKKEINQRIYASNAVEKKWKAIYYFSFSIISRVTTKFSASKRASDETGLRSWKLWKLSSPLQAVCSQQFAER